MGCPEAGAPETGEVFSVKDAGAPVLDLEEARLIRDAVAGDLRAFESLYRRHGGRVYAIALRLTGSPGRSEEIVQDVFLQVWKRLGTFEGRSRFSTWLHRLTVNRSVDTLRGDLPRSRREQAAGSPSDWESGAPGSIRVEPAPREQGAPWDLERAVASLPAGARAVFVLHDVEGYRHEEIAEMTGTTAGTTKAQLHRARRLLREQLSR
jgi:RNA polymerase sigma-70 factor (ECF subfamily)